MPSGALQGVATAGVERVVEGEVRLEICHSWVDHLQACPQRGHQALEIPEMSPERGCNQSGLGVHCKKIHTVTYSHLKMARVCTDCAIAEISIL